MTFYEKKFEQTNKIEMSIYSSKMDKIISKLHHVYLLLLYVFEEIFQIFKLILVKLQ